MEKLGIEPSLLLAQIVNFTIIIIVLKKLLYKPILEILEKRKKEIEEGLALTEKMRLEEEKLKEKRAKLLDQARGEAQGIIAEARKKAKEEEKAIVDEASRESKDIVGKGREEVLRLKDAMQKDVRSYAVSLSIAMAKKLLSSVLTSGDKQKILESHVKDLESVRVS